MELEEAKTLIDCKKNKGMVKAIGNIINEKGYATKYIIVQVENHGLITAYDDKTSNIQINSEIKLGDRVEFTILDGMIIWNLIKNNSQNYFVPYSIDMTQIVNPIEDIPEIRVYEGNGRFVRFNNFRHAVEYHNRCKHELNLHTPVIAFKGLEVDLWDIRKDN